MPRTAQLSCAPDAQAALHLCALSPGLHVIEDFCWRGLGGVAWAKTTDSPAAAIRAQARSINRTSRRFCPDATRHSR